MLNLRKQIDFGLLGEEGDHPLVNKMELDDYLSEETSPSPPAVKVARIPVSRVYQRRRSVDDTNQNSPPCTPGSNGAPRTHTRLPSSGGGGGSFQYFTTPSPTQPQARVTRLFSKPTKKSLSKTSPEKSENLNLSRKLQKSVNTNPFTPQGESQTGRKRQFYRYSSTPALEKFKKLEFDEHEPSPVKRIRVADFSVTNSRYQEEFLEIGEIASGEFGCVKRARHRLDGVDYAVKISKKNLDYVSRHDEKMALNEVFAHAALIKHKHFVRYYNSWVEGGHVYIQNEFCRGGSLSLRIKEMKSCGQQFTETELRKIVVQILKGLQYIHNKQLVHLDIKPDNILIAVEDESSTAAAAAREGSHVDYKIGDLGHVAHIFTDNISPPEPEEGDCRYMAPEFLQMNVDPQHLYKADIFSLGLTMYEAASLSPLPRNSGDDEELYSAVRRGQLPYLPHYSDKFNSLLARMVTPSLTARPDTAQLLAETHPKCNLLLEWGDGGGHEHGAGSGSDHATDSTDNTSEDTSLEEFDLSNTENMDNSKLDLIKAQERIFNLEKQLKSKDSQISHLNDSLKSIDTSIKESSLNNDEKVQKYEALLRKIKVELQSAR